MALQQPAGAEKGALPSRQIDPAALRKAIPPRLEGPPGSVFYRLGLPLVAAAMVLLPLAYLGLVALAGYGVYWHATEHTAWLAGAGLRVRLVVYAAPHAAGAGMRLSGWIRQMDFWFARLVYERDRFDQALAEARSEGNTVALFTGLGALGVWIGRRVLRLLMRLGHAISCSFVRRMEFDADRYEIALVASAGFAGTARKLAVLHRATELAFGELHEAWREGRLGDDLPRLIASKSEALPEETRAALEQHALAAQTGLFDTHPSDRQRIARAEKAALPGVFELDAPASVVFADFAGICRQMTLGRRPRRGTRPGAGRAAAGRALPGDRRLRGTPARASADRALAAVPPLPAPRVQSSADAIAASILVRSACLSRSSERRSSPRGGLLDSFSNGGDFSARAVAAGSAPARSRARSRALLLGSS